MKWYSNPGAPTVSLRINSVPSSLYTSSRVPEKIDPTTSVKVTGKCQDTADEELDDEDREELELDKEIDPE